MKKVAWNLSPSCNTLHHRNNIASSIFYKYIFITLETIKKNSGLTTTLVSFVEIKRIPRYNTTTMKHYRDELSFKTETRRAYINITPEIAHCIQESGIQNGLVLCNAMHISASVFINDDEPGLHQDFETWLETLAPEHPHDQYAHNGYEDNADAHLKRSIMGREVVVAITNGQLDFGPWEQIFYGEFDGMREKRVLVKIIGD